MIFCEWLQFDLHWFIYRYFLWYFDSMPRSHRPDGNARLFVCYVQAMHSLVLDNPASLFSRPGSLVPQADWSPILVDWERKIKSTLGGVTGFDWRPDWNVALSQLTGAGVLPPPLIIDWCYASLGSILDSSVAFDMGALPAPPTLKPDFSRHYTDVNSFVIRHPSTPDKLSEWTLVPSPSPIWVVGSSNLSRLLYVQQPLPLSDCSVQSFPGARIHHLSHIFGLLSGFISLPRIIIFNIGLNNRSDKPRNIRADLLHLLQVTKRVFPCSQLFFQLINISPFISDSDQDILTQLNQYFSELAEVIPLLPIDQFHIFNDSSVPVTNWIHWTSDTAFNFAVHWRHFIRGLTAPLPQRVGNVLNLSRSLVLSPLQLRVLEKGLSFIPFDVDSIQGDLK